VPCQLVAYMATYGTQFFSFKCYHCHLFTTFVMLKTNKWNEINTRSLGSPLPNGPTAEWLSNQSVPETDLKSPRHTPINHSYWSISAPARPWPHHSVDQWLFLQEHTQLQLISWPKLRLIFVYKRSWPQIASSSKPCKHSCQVPVQLRPDADYIPVSAS